LFCFRGRRGNLLKVITCRADRDPHDRWPARSTGAAG
jgi:hypothetical protein